MHVRVCRVSSVRVNDKCTKRHVQLYRLYRVQLDGLIWTARQASNEPERPLSPGRASGHGDLGTVTAVTTTQRQPLP